MALTANLAINTPATAPETTAANFPGEATITSILLQSVDKKVQLDIRAFVLEFNIIEDIFKSYMYGNITIHDTIGIYTSFPILGEEYITISYSTQLRPDITKTYTFQVYAIGEYLMKGRGESVIYTLDFINPDQILNAINIQSQNFSGTISTIITSILTNNTFIGTSRPTNIQQTSTIVDYTLPVKTPFEVIDFLRNRAYTTTQNDSNYFLFFENFDGYTFTSLSNLITASLAKKALLDSVDANSTIITLLGDLRHIPVNSDIDAFTKNMLSGAFAKYKNTFDSLNSGAYNSTVNVFDINQRTFTSTVQKYRDTFNSTVHIDPTSNNAIKQTSTFLDIFESVPSNFQYMTLDSTQTDFTYLPKVAATKLQHFLMFEENPLVGTIYGDPRIVAGDIYNINIPEFSSNKDRKFDRFMSGNYLIGRIIHNVQLAKYTMQLHLYKDNYNTVISSNTAAF